MAVKNIECQLAEMQIGRYVSGEPFSNEAVRQLEAHVANCPRCANILNDRKASLRAMLQREPRAAVEVEESPRFNALDNPLLKALREKAPAATPKEPVGARPSQAAARATLFQQLLQKGPVNPPETPQAVPANVGEVGSDWPTPVRPGIPNPKSKIKNLKLVSLCAALALVMVAMSWFSKDQSSVFGESADKLPTKIDATIPAKHKPKYSKATKAPAIPPAGSQADSQPANPAPVANSANLSPGPNSPSNDEPNAPAKANRSRDAALALSAEQDSSEVAPPVRRAHHVHRAPKPAPRRRHYEARPKTAPKPRHPNSIKVYSPDGDPM